MFYLLTTSSQQAQLGDLACQFLQVRDLSLREVQELARGHPAVTCKITDSNQICLWPKLSCAPLLTVLSPSLHREFCKDRQLDGLPDEGPLRGACQGEQAVQNSDRVVWMPPWLALHD